MPQVMTFEKIRKIVANRTPRDMYIMKVSGIYCICHYFPQRFGLFNVHPYLLKQHSNVVLNQPFYRFYSVLCQTVLLVIGKLNINLSKVSVLIGWLIITYRRFRGCGPMIYTISFHPFLCVFRVIILP